MRIGAGLGAHQIRRKVNAVRNAVVHQGSFSNTPEAEAVFTEAKAFINMIVGLSIEAVDIDQQRTLARGLVPPKEAPN